MSLYSATSMRGNISSTTTVNVQLSVNNHGNKQAGPQFTKTLGQLEVDLTPSNQPVFPTQAIALINNNNSLSGEMKAQKVKELIDLFTSEQAAYAYNGGRSVEDRILGSVVRYLEVYEGYNRNTQKSVKANELQISSFTTANGEVVFTVSGTSTWGQ